MFNTLCLLLHAFSLCFRTFLHFTQLLSSRGFAAVCKNTRPAVAMTEREMKRLAAHKQLESRAALLTHHAMLSMASPCLFKLDSTLANTYMAYMTYYILKDILRLYYDLYISSSIEHYI